MSRTDQKNNRPASPAQRAHKLREMLPSTHLQALGLVATCSHQDLSMTPVVLNLLREGMVKINRGKGARADQAYTALNLEKLLGLPCCLIRRREDRSLRVESPKDARDRLVEAAKTRAAAGELTDEQVDVLVKKAKILSYSKGQEAKQASRDSELQRLRQQLAAAQQPTHPPLARSVPTDGDLHEVATEPQMPTRDNKVVSMIGHPATQRTNPGADNGLAPRKATGS